MAAAYKVISGSDFINVVISSSSPECALCVEKRFKKDITVADLKGKLEMITGGNPATMTVMVYDNDDKEVCQLSDDAALVGSYPIDDGMRLHVVDQFILRSQIGDNAEGDKYEMSVEEYAKRPDTVRAFLAQNRLGKYNEEEMKRREEERLKEEAEEEEAAKAITVGDRCEISMPGAPKRRGTVRFVGLTDFKKGWWIGVQYDEPLGKNDGSAEGKRYFECPPKYGGFVKPAFVAVGDYPEEELDLDEM